MRNGDISVAGRDVDLGQLLREDIKGEATDSLVELLRESSLPLSRALRGNLPQDHYLLWQRLLNTLHAAEQVLLTAREEIHGVR